MSDLHPLPKLLDPLIGPVGRNPEITRVGLAEFEDEEDRARHGDRAETLGKDGERNESGGRPEAAGD